MFHAKSPAYRLRENSTYRFIYLKGGLPSGEPIPKINSWNTFGCILLVDDANNIFIKYNYFKDLRPNKNELVPHELRKEDITIVRWSAERMRNFVENKFNQNGWFKCLKDSNGTYKSIVFGAPMSFENWIELVKKGIVFFDSGMYFTNARPYSMWRASNLEWSKLGLEEFDETILS